MEKNKDTQVSEKIGKIVCWILAILFVLISILTISLIGYAKSNTLYLLMLHDAQLVDESIAPLEDFSQFTCPAFYSTLKAKETLLLSSANNETENRGRNVRSNQLEGGKIRTLMSMSFENQAIVKRALEKNVANMQLQNVFVRSVDSTNDNTSKINYGNITLTEAFLNSFSIVCQEQKNSSWKNGIRFPGPAESTYLYEYFNVLFKRVNGFRLFNTLKEFEAANITAEDIWWTYGNSQNWLNFAGPIQVGPQNNELDDYIALALHPSNEQIPINIINSNSSDSVEKYNEHITSINSTYYIALLYTEHILNVTSPITQDDIVIALKNGIKFTVDTMRILAASNASTAVDTRKFSAIQSSAIEDRRNRTFSLEQLIKRFPHILWRPYLDGLGVSITSKTRMVVKNTKYLELLDKYFGKKANHPELLLLNSVTLGTIVLYLYNLKYVDCNKLLDTYMPESTAYRYVRSIPLSEREEKIYETNKMVKPIIEEYGHAIKEADWMTPGTKKKALEKLKAMDVNLGWPDWYKLDEPLEFSDAGIAKNASIDKYHWDFFGPLFSETNGAFFPNYQPNPEDDLSKFDQNEADFIRVILTMSWAYMNGQFKKVGLKEERFDGIQQADVINARYNSVTNTLAVAYAWINTFLDKEKLVENYGKIGFTIAHEIGHGYDPNGLLYGKDGKLEKWLDKESAQNFDKIQQCVVERYSAQCCPKQAAKMNAKCVDGWFTQGENFADISGVTIAYRAFKKRQRLLKGGQIDIAKRRFWVGYGDLWCRLPQENDAFETTIKTDVHSPNECRVNLALESIPQFHIDFGEEPPKNQRCHLWNAKPL